MAATSFGPISASVRGNEDYSGTVTFLLPDSLRLLVHSTASIEGLAPAAVFLTVFQELLRRLSGQESVAVSFQHGEQMPRGTVLADNLSFRASIQRNLLNPAGKEHGRWGPAAVDGQFFFEAAPRCVVLTSPILCSVQNNQGELRVFVEFHRKSWHPAAMDALAASFQTLLQSGLENPDLPFGQCGIVTSAEIEQFNTWNQTRRPYPTLRVDQLFERQVERTPHNPAITFDGESMSYLALFEEASHLAGQLQALGVGPNTLVGVCIDRCHEMVTALLAVFMAGGAYLPLDPSFPPDRIRFMQEDARPLVVLTQAHLPGTLPFIAPHVLAVAHLGATGKPAAVHGSQIGSLDDLAYVIYTSGSTGKPKGVRVTHRALTNLLSGVSPELPLETSDVFLATSTISFDISAFEIFAPLIAGAQLVIARRSEAADGELLSSAIREVGATVLQATPSGWRILLEAGWDGQPGLKMLTAGEPLDRTLARNLLARGSTLWNLYGPTEATIYATGQQITGEAITIGKPLANYSAYVLDYHGNRIPVGAVGELHLGGIGIAQGYLNRPELTQEKFIDDEFGEQPGGRLYRTGDLARFLPDGQIELLGRADNQIKLRGHRIELEEVEALLDSHVAVRRSVVTVVDVDEGDQRLVAYIVPKQAGKTDLVALREYAVRGLPAYMVPSTFVMVDSFSLTPSGKVDRKALRGSTAFQSFDQLSQSSGDLEQIVLSCWKSALSIAELGPDAHFFEFGGHSLLAVRLCCDISNRLARKIPVSWLFEAPTPRAFVERLQEKRESSATCLVRMQTQGRLQPIYLVHPLLGQVFVYRALADCFAPERPVYGIQPPEDFAKRARPYPLESLAAEYVSCILQRQSEGPFHLAGYSSGAVIVFEMARQMTAAGLEVGLLGLIGGDIAVPKAKMSPWEKFRNRLVRATARIGFMLRGELRQPSEFIRTRLRYYRLVWRIRQLQKPGPHTDGEATIEEALLLTERAYRPQPYAGKALLLRFRDEAWDLSDDPMMGWSGLISGGIETIDVPGGHLSGMSAEAAPHLADILNARMKEAEDSSAVTKPGRS
jgi:amino acid adenylation domain-containing protein